MAGKKWPQKVPVCLPANRLLVNVESLYRDITKELSAIYHQSTVEEWVSTYVSPCREKLKKIVSDADLQIAVNAPVWLQPYRTDGLHTMLQEPQPDLEDVLEMLMVSILHFNQA